MSIRFHLISIVGIAVLVAASCSNDSPQIAQSEWERLIAVRGEARDLYQSQLLFRYEFLTASDASTDTLNWIERNRQAISQSASNENLSRLQKIEDSFSADSEDELKVRRLRHYLLSLRMTEMTADATQYLQEMRQSARFDFEDRIIDLSTLMAILSEYRDRDRRQHAYVLWIEQLRKENAIFERIVKLQDSTAVIFGYGDFASLMQDAQELDYAVLAEQARLFLARTDSLYNVLAEQVIPRCTGVKADKLRGYDMMFLGNSVQAAGLSISDTVKARIATALGRMGLNTDSNVSFATADDYQFRPETFPVLIPDDIRVVLGERANVPEYLHELGHALHYHYTAEREFEFSQLGQGGLKEAYAFVLEGLLDESKYVEECFGLSGTQLSDYLEQRAFSRLLAIRSYCGDFLFEQKVFAGLPELRTEYEQIKQPITGFSWTDIEREQMFQRIDGFSSAEYLTGWFLAARIREHLRDKLGERWYETAESGQYLKDLWKSGTRRSAAEIARSLGDTLVAPDALLREFNSAVNE